MLARRTLLATAICLSLLALSAGSAWATLSPIPVAGMPQTNPGASVNAIAVAPDGDTVYVGGDFTTFGGQSRNILAAFSLSTGTVLPWSPTASGNNQFPVIKIVATSTDVYVAGSIDTINGTARQGIAKIGASGSGTLDGAWNANMNAGGYVYDLALDGTSLFIGGYFSTVNSGVARANIAKLSTSTGAADGSWNPGASGSNPTVLSLLVSGNDLYVGGSLTTIGGQARNGLAKLSTSGSGTVNSSWNPNVSSSSPFVYSMALSGSSLYVGGQFTTIGGQTVSNLAKVSATGAVDTSWVPLAGSTVLGLTMLNDQVYVAGSFFTLANAARNYLGALDPTTGAASNWYPNPNGPSCNFCSVTMRSVATSGTTLIAGGNSQTFGVGSDALVRYGIAVFRTVDAPVVEDPPTIVTPETPDSLKNKQNLTCDKGTWSSPFDEPSYSYQWQRDGDPVGGAESSIYTLSPNDAGSQLACQVTAANIGGTTVATSSVISVGNFTATPAGGGGSSATPEKVTIRILTNGLGTAMRGKLKMKVGCSTGDFSATVKVRTTGFYPQVNLATFRADCAARGSHTLKVKVSRAARRALRRAIERRNVKKVMVLAVAKASSTSRTSAVLRLV